MSNIWENVIYSIEMHFKVSLDIEDTSEIRNFWQIPIEFEFYTIYFCQRFLWTFFGGEFTACLKINKTLELAHVEKLRFFKIFFILF